MRIFLLSFCFFGSSYKYTEHFSTKTSKAPSHNPQRSAYNCTKCRTNTQHKPAEGAFIEYKASEHPNDVIQPEIPLGKGGGIACEENAPEYGREHILRGNCCRMVGDEPPQQTEYIKQQTTGNPQQAGTTEQCKLLFRAEKGFRYDLRHHRSNLPKRLRGLRRSRSPYCTDQMSPVMHIAPVSMLMDVMCRSLPLMVSSPCAVKRIISRSSKLSTSVTPESDRFRRFSSIKPWVFCSCRVLPPMLVMGYSMRKRVGVCVEHLQLYR